MTVIPAGPEPAEPGASPTPAQLSVIQEGLLPWAHRLKAAGKDDPNFLDVGVRPAENRVIVHQVFRHGVPDKAYYQGVVPTGGITVRFEPAMFTSTQLDEINAAVKARLSDFDAAGVKLTRWGQHDGLDKPFVVEYSAGQLPAELVNAMQIFGPGTVVFRSGGEVVSLGRYTDTDLFGVGDFVTNQ